jgi:hypothetical protein
MLTTNSNPQPRVTVSSPLVTVSSGTARIGNTLAQCDGTMITFNALASFSGSTGYRSSLLYLTQNGMAVDLATALSDTTSSVVGIIPPSMPADTSAYATGYPLGLFTFSSTDGTVANLLSYRIS